MKFWIKIFLFIVLLSGSPSVLGQKNSAETERAIWRARSVSIADIVVKNSSKVDDLERATILAILAESWWKVDRLQSQAWLEKSVDGVFFLSEQETLLDPKGYLAAVKKIASVAAGRDQKQFNRIMSIAEGAKGQSQTRPTFDSDTIMEIAMIAVKSSPSRGLELGVLAFKIGQPTKFHPLYWELKKVDALYAEKFIRAAIASLSGNALTRSVLEMRTAVFPELNLPNVPPPIISPSSVKVAALNFFADFATQKYLQLVNKSVNECSIEASILVPVLPQFDLLLLTRASAVIQMITMCRAANPADTGGQHTGPEASSSATVEGLIKLADDATGELRLRVYYLLRAVALANDLKKYGLATDILDGMTEEERKTDVELWVVLRFTVASGWAFQQYQNGEIGRARQILESVVSDTRPFSKIGFVLKFKSYDADSTAFCLSLITEAEKELAKSDRPLVEKSNYWLKVVTLYASFNQYLDASNSFSSFIKALNGETSAENKILPKIRISDIGSSILPKHFEAQYDSLITTAESINAPSVRVQVLIELMKSALAHLGGIKDDDVKNY